MCFTFLYFLLGLLVHYNDVIMGMMASQITRFTIVYSTVFSGTDQRIHQRSTSLAFVWGIHRWLLNSQHKWPVMQKMFPLDDIIMNILTATHDRLVCCFNFLHSCIYSVNICVPVFARVTMECEIDSWHDYFKISNYQGMIQKLISTCWALN